MRLPKVVAAGLMLGVLCVAGCASTGGGSQLQNTIYDTHRRVAGIEKNMQGSVTQLNETTAGLLARVDASDQQIKTLQGTVEENTVKLQGIEKKLDSLANSLYRYFGMSQGTRVSPSETTPGGGVRVVPPGGTAPSGMTEPAEPGALAPLTPPSPGVPSAAPPVQPGLAPSAAAPGMTPPPAATAPAAVPPVAGATTAPAAASPAASAAPAASAVPTSGSADQDYQQAQGTLAKQDYAAALEQFNAYLQRYPNSENASNAQFWKAKALQGMEQYEPAIAEFGKVRTNYANSSKVPYAMHQQAVCHGRLGQTERAIELFQEVIKDFPMTPAADQAKSDLKRLQGKQ